MMPTTYQWYGVTSTNGCLACAWIHSSLLFSRRFGVLPTHRHPAHPCVCVISSSSRGGIPGRARRAQTTRYLVELGGHKLRDKTDKQKRMPNVPGTKEQDTHKPDAHPHVSLNNGQRLLTRSLCGSKMFASSTSRYFQVMPSSLTAKPKNENHGTNERVSEQNCNKSQVTDGTSLYTKKHQQMSQPKHGRGYDIVGTRARTDGRTRSKKNVNCRVPIIVLEEITGLRYRLR